MISNLAKTPLMAVFYAALITFSGVFLPFTPQYNEALTAFAMPIPGHLLLIGFALLISVIIMFALSTMHDRGTVSVVLLFLTMTGFLWVIPSLALLWFGDPERVMTNQDVILNMIRGTLCTLLLLVLAMLLYPRNAKAAKIPMRHKLRIPGFIIKMLVLPFLYFFLYLADWYFLSWNNDVLRAYSGGPEVRENMVTAIINLFLRNPILPAFMLISGLIYVIFLLPLMTRMPDNKAPFLVLILLLTVSPGIYSLIPAPWIRADLQVSFFLRDTILSVVFGLISAVLLHASYKRLPAEVVKPTMTPQVGQRTAQPTGISAKQAAAAVQSTMRRS